LELEFANPRLLKLLSSERDLQRAFGAAGAKKVQAHLKSLQAAGALGEFRFLPGRCHELTGNRSGQLALDLPDGNRLIFEPAADPPPEKADGGLDWAAVRSVRILEISDYH
jgi:plasmid maintenance system killer protein